MRWCPRALRHAILEPQRCHQRFAQPVAQCSPPWHAHSFSTVRCLWEDADDHATETKNPARWSPLKTHANLERIGVAPDASVTCAGLVRSIRKQKKIAFASVSDGSTLDSFQAVLSPQDAKDIQNGAYVKLEGKWKASQGAGQKNELMVGRVLSHGLSDPAVSPIQKKAMSVDHLRAYPHLRLRIPLYALLARTRAFVFERAHFFYGGVGSSDADAEEDQALYVQPPLITSSDCEGAGETFTISPKAKSTISTSSPKEEKHYFRTPKYLTVSSQLHLEAFSAELGNVWTLSPTFRAEESDTARHLSEFWMLESEFRSIDNLHDLTRKVERLIKFITKSLIESPLRRELLTYHADNKQRQDDRDGTDLEARWDALLSSKWTTIGYADAISALQDTAAVSPNLFQYHPSWENGLQLEHERWIAEHIGNNKPVFVTHYPKAQKPFYMLDSQKRADAEPAVECFDLLLPYGICEVAGGSLRHHDLQKLIGAMREKGLLKSSRVSDTQSGDEEQPSDSESYPGMQRGESLNTLEWYADLRRYGSSPHGGFGVGVDRLLMYLTGIHHVRDIVPFPRTFGTALC